MFKNQMACTTMLVGKKASIDGSTMIARNEDYPKPIGPIAFNVVPERNQHHAEYHARESGIKVPLPDHAYRYTAQPINGNHHHAYEEGGINEKNVAMSATETIFTNERFLGADPLVKHGINEEAIPTLVLPYVDNARAGVKRLGQLIEKYGTGESNGIAFSDHDEVWYLETAGGHHWVAERIPDNAYAIAPNQTMIQNVNFDDPDHFMYSADLPKFVKDHHLNPTPGTFNFRQIAGTHSTWDSVYNTPRAWYGQRMFSPEIHQAPTSQHIAFVHHANRKLSVQDVERFLSSHYQNTPYDPLNHPNLLNHPKFRPIAINRNAASHILQIRNDVDPNHAAIEWLALGFLSYSPFVPFYTNIDRTPANYQVAGSEVTPQSAYWLFKSLLVYVEPHYHEFIDQVNAYRRQVQAYGLNQIALTDQRVQNQSGPELTKSLTKATDQTTGQICKMTKHLISDLIKRSLNQSKVRF